MGKRTIALTDRPQLLIDESQWPRIVSVTGDSFDGYMHEYLIAIRRHQADGRYLVYAVYDGKVTGSHEGELLDPDEDMAGIRAAINRVGKRCGIPFRLLFACSFGVWKDQLPKPKAK